MKPVVKEEEVLLWISQQVELVSLSQGKTFCTTTKLKQAYFRRSQRLMKEIWSLT